MTSEFDEIYSRFYLKMKDYDFANLDDDTMEEILSAWLKAAASRPYVRRIFENFELDTDLREIEYTLKTGTTEEEDKDFVEEVLAKGMVVEWLTPEVQSVLNTQQVYSGKETNFFSQSSHLSSVKDLLYKTQSDQRKYIQDRGYIYNRYLRG